MKINADLKKHRGKTKEQLAELKTNKLNIVPREDAARTAKNLAEFKVKTAKAARDQAQKVEADNSRDRGGAYERCNLGK